MRVCASLVHNWSCALGLMIYRTVPRVKFSAFLLHENHTLCLSYSNLWPRFDDAEGKPHHETRGKPPTVFIHQCRLKTIEYGLWNSKFKHRVISVVEMFTYK